MRGVVFGIGAVGCLVALRTRVPLVAYLKEVVRTTTFDDDHHHDDDDDEKKLTVEISSDYAERPGRAYGMEVVEPHRVTRLCSHSSCQWNIAKKDVVFFEGLGECAEVKFTDVGDYAVQVRCDDDESKEAVLPVACRYVRRDIRGLLDADRERLFDAFKTLASYDTDAGKLVFGDDFRSLDGFAKIHLERAAKRQVDAMHDGLGFLTQHVALTNELELALQAIDPSLAVPYWDYTQDSTRVRTSGRDVSALWDDALWSSSWFGNATGPEHYVAEGRFAFQKVDKGGPTTNPYGYARAPWNVNKSPFVTRAHTFCDRTFSMDTWPSCASHYDMTFAIDSFYDWVWQIGYAPHGPIHIFVGGYAGCGDMEERFRDFNLTEKALKSLSLLAISLPKSGWRNFLFESPEFCSEDTPQSDCHLVCARQNDHRFAELIFKYMYDFVEVFAAKDADDFHSDFFHEIRRANRVDAFVDAVCSLAWYPGEQMEAASPVDVSFWPIHPTVERLFQYKLYANPFLYAAWGATNATTTYCIYEDTSDCMGHHPYDLTSFKSRVKNASGDFEVKFLTNLEVLEALVAGPDYKMSYVYDNFSWPHCSDAGYVFPRVDDAFSPSSS
ncbi:hypothetical protein CTAYLR_009044 [Chrysophaeum taylorii]|uniref:Tyrosinase copper-binding domain-containing protein n=1 Tax=Chrysophaeum taylorii TaxID=2483200 RepID=A0AAD7XN00_9STRA|nr:hypothetical protein CTAYLR_009044 [Chrysophaeum taylorii]